MSSNEDLKRKEVDDNFSAISKMMREQKIPSEMYGKFALMKSKNIKGYFSSFEDAYQAGTLKYEDNLFSIQQIRVDVVDLGYYSHGYI